MPRKEKITEEIPAINRPRSGYEEVEEGIQTSITLTTEQHEFIDDVARTYDLKWWAAFEMVWNDAFKLLKIYIETQSNYSDLPGYQRPKKIVG